MKKLPLLILFIFFVSNSHAQRRTEKNTKNIQAIKNNVSSLLASQFHRSSPAIAPGSKKTNTYERLTSLSEYNYTDTIFHSIGYIDSESYIYSGGGSSFDFNYMNYNSAWTMAGDIPYGYGTNVAKLAHNNVPAVFCDSVLIYDDYFGTFSFYDTRYATYDSNYNITNYADLYLSDTSMLYYNNKFVNTFDAYQNSAKTYAFNWYFGAEDSAQYRAFSYDSNHNILEDSSQDFDFVAGGWAPSYRWLYTYNSYGKIAKAYGFNYNGTTLTWDSLATYAYTYTTDTLLQTFTVASLDTSGLRLVPSYVDSFGYSSGLQYAIYKMNKQYDNTGTLQYTSVLTKHINAEYVPDTTYEIQYDNLSNVIGAEKTVYSYNAFNDPTKAIIHNIDTFTHPWSYDIAADYVITYHYAPFTPGPSWIEHIGGPAYVSNITATKKNISIYPNPANTEIFITTPDIQQGASTNINIFNSIGQLIKTESLNWSGRSEKISIADLAAGTYYIVVEDNSTKSISKSSMIKL